MSEPASHLEVPRRASSDEMPILDLQLTLAGSPDSHIVEQFRNACTETGFFYVRNGGVRPGTVQGVFDAARRYFACPTEEKLRDRVDERFRRGYMPFGGSQHPGLKPDLKESYDFAVDLPLDNPDVVGMLPFHGPNKWPEDKPWLREAALRYFTEARTLALALVRVMALAMRQPEDYFDKWCTKPMVQSRILHYPAQAAPSADELGAASHTDYGLLTVLAQDPLGGLELQTRRGEWLSAPWIADAVVVNLGDMVRNWTNDAYVSNAHRVVNRTGKDRYSMPLFFSPNYHAPLDCLPGFCSPAGPSRYAPTVAGEYLLSRMREVQKFRPPSAAMPA